MAPAARPRVSRARAGRLTGSAALLEGFAELPIRIARRDGELFFPNNAALANICIVRRPLECVSRMEVSVTRTVCLYAYNTLSLTLVITTLRVPYIYIYPSVEAGRSSFRCKDE
jgi:hypothetical protein